MIIWKENWEELKEWYELYLNEEKISFCFKMRFENKYVLKLKIKCKEFF